MRTVMTKCLIDPQTYQRLTNVDGDSEYSNFMCRSKEMYEDALRSLPNLEPPAEFQGIYFYLFFFFEKLRNKITKIGILLPKFF